MEPVAALLPCGTRLHLQHGPIDLIIGADGNRDASFAAAQARFSTVLDELVSELPLLRQPIGADTPAPDGEISLLMAQAAQPHSAHYITPMAAVAGAVADTILAAMRAATPLRRAYVNNGGDIAIHLDPGEVFTTAMAQLDGADMGRITIAHGDGVGGIATSGAGGRSLSRGIADAVTVLAASAAQADATATMIANAVDLPGHPEILRQSANDLQPDSDLGDLPVTVHCPRLCANDIHAALQRGYHFAERLHRKGLIRGAALFLQRQSRLVGQPGFTQTPNQRIRLNA